MIQILYWKKNANKNFVAATKIKILQKNEYVTGWFDSNNNITTILYVR